MEYELIRRAIIEKRPSFETADNQQIMALWDALSELDKKEYLLMAKQESKKHASGDGSKPNI